MYVEDEKYALSRFILGKKEWLDISTSINVIHFINKEKTHLIISLDAKEAFNRSSCHI